MLQIQRLILDVDDVLEVNLGTYDFSNNPSITYLHCNNAYPTPLEDINLGTMKYMLNNVKHVKWFKNTKVGLSDHTPGIIVPPIAVSHGASTIEKHFTLDRKMKGPDHPFAIEPDELTQMVKNIRDAEKVMGVKSSEYTPSEKMFVKARRSVVAKKDIKKGQVLSEDNITTKRPFLKDSIPAIDYYKVIGKRANTNISSDEILRKEQIDD